MSTAPSAANEYNLTSDQMAEMESDVVTLLQELIQIPSVNHGEGKGDEKAVAEYVAAKLAEVGIESEIIETAPNRLNVVARIPGVDQTRGGLVVHGHLDVVPANAADWSVDPFGGVIKDGYIWGRCHVDLVRQCSSSGSMMNRSSKWKIKTGIETATNVHLKKANVEVNWL